MESERETARKRRNMCYYIDRCIYYILLCWEFEYSACDSIRIYIGSLCVALRSDFRWTMPNDLKFFSATNAHQRRTISEIKIDSRYEIRRKRRRKTVFQLNHSAKKFSFLLVFFSFPLPFVDTVVGVDAGENSVPFVCEKMPEKERERERQIWKGKWKIYKKKNAITLCYIV